MPWLSLVVPHRRVLPAAVVFALGTIAGFASTNLSTWVYPGTSGRLVHQADFIGNRVLDTSGVGYKGGTVPLPTSNTVPVKVTISPVAGDNTANIQSAINSVQAMPLDANGFRGAVLLSAGEYPCASSVTISASGVVLRGVGSFTNGSGTVLRATASNQYSLVRITGSGSASTSTSHTITNRYVPVGARSFQVDTSSGFAAGDRVFVRRNTTTNWIHDIGMDVLTNAWTPSGYTVNMDRTITRIEGNRIFIDNPVTCAIDAGYANGSLLKYTWSGRITNSGIEHIFGKSDFFGNSTNENHGWVFVQFNSIENGFARDIVSQYFGYACVGLYSGSKNVTVADSQCLDPISIITGGRRYAFVMDDDTDCLVKNCYTRQDRHQFVTQSMTTGPNVFVDGTSDSAHAEAGPHHRWATAALWDRITVNGHDLDAQNTCESGTGHGWEGANCVIWNSKANSLKVASPPTAHNWLIGSIGSVSKGGDCHGIVSPPGVWESSGTTAANVFPESLYFGDLQDRLAAPKLQTREYWLGVIDGFTNAIPRDAVTLDSTWSNAVQTLAGAQPLDPFNVVSNAHWIPFTFNYAIGATDQIVGATLTLAMRSVTSAGSDALYLGATNNSVAFSSLNWLPVGTGTNTTVRVVDLGAQLNLLTNGQFNVAVQGDAGIDWALLELNVAPAVNAGTTILTPVADATVRGGVNGNLNFGTAGTLTVQNDAAADNTRQAYLRWDLTGITQTVFQARIRLTPVSSGATAEQGVRIANSNNWSETAITFNNQPGGGERFANYIPGSNAVVSFDVTPQVVDALTGDKQISVQLYSVRNVGAAGVVDYGSRENADPNVRPQLVLTMLGSAPVISDITNRTIPVSGSAGPIAFTIGDSDSDANSLVVSGASSDTTLVPNANIVFGGSGSNRTVTVTPAAGQSGAAVITISVSDISGLSAFDTFTLTVSSHAPGVFVWNGTNNASANTNWSTAGNWSPSGPPETLDDVKFFDNGTAAAVSNVNNVVDATFGGTIASLQFGNTNGNHTTVLAAGQTLSVLGAAGLLAGTGQDNGADQKVNATIAGPGALAVLNAAAPFNVRQGSTTSGTHRATLNLSGLDTLTANVSRLLIGGDGASNASNRPTGTLLLARTNLISVSGSAPAVNLGDGPSNGGNGVLTLGQTNALFADTITIGRQKSSATVSFNPAFAAPSFYLRGKNADRVATIAVGDNSAQSASGSPSSGAIDLSAGTVDAMADLVYLGKGQTGNGGGTASGTLTLGGGTFDVNTIEAGYQNATTAASVVSGTINLNAGAALVVNSSLRLARFTGSGTAPVGTLNVNGASVSGNGSILAGGGASTITVNAGTLALTGTIGTPAAPVGNASLTSATLQFSVAATGTNFVATTLTTGGSSNVINIASLPAIGSVPAQFPLIKYSSAIGGAGFNFALGSLPAAIVIGGYVSNNTANGSVDLVITNYLVPDAFLTWDGAATADWDTETGNWKNNVSSGLTYADGEDVLFNDTASGSTAVNLTDAFAPASVTVSNNALPYFFDGPGNVTGPTALLKSGSGALVIENNGSNDFTGGVTILGGTLSVGGGGVSGNLPASGTISNNAALVFNRSDSLALSNVISGSGVVAQSGDGLLTLGAANTFSGKVFITNGTLRLSNGSALGATNGSTIVSNGATLDFNHLNVANEPVFVAGAGVGGNGALVDNSGNPGFLSPQTVAYVTLTGDATFGGTGRWDLRSNPVTITNSALSTGGNPFKLTKAGTNQVSLVGVAVDAALGDIDVQAGLLSVEKVTTSLGDPAHTLTVFSNATLQFFQESNVVNKLLVLSNGATVLNFSGSNTWGGRVTLQGQPTLNVGGNWLKFTNELAGPGGLVKIGASPLMLLGSNSYSGATLVNAGALALTNAGSIGGSTNVMIAAGATLDASGRGDATLTLLSGQTLAGGGSVVGNLFANSGSTIAPGSNALGVLTISGAATLGGVAVMELNRASSTNDVLQVSGALTYGGTLSLTNLGGALAPGDSFKLFNASSYNGSFAAITPPVPRAGWMWDTSQLNANGTLGIAVAPRPVIASFAFANGSLIFSGTNGQPYEPYWVLGSTNVALPLANWSVLATNVFDGVGNFSVTNAVDPAAAQGFYAIELQ